MSEAFYATTIMPLTIMIDTPVFGITTPKPRGNWFMEVINAVDDSGKRLFRSLNFETICPNCSLKGRAAMMKCKCKLGQNNSWRSQSIMDKWAKAFGDKIASQELKGVSFDEESIFDSDLVSKFCKDFSKCPTYVDGSEGLRRREPTFYGVYVDPNNGGRSGIGIVIAAHTGPKTRIVWINVQQSSNKRTFKEILKENIEEFRAKFDPRQKALLWFFVESNTNVHSNDARDLSIERRWKHCVHFRQLPGEQERYGVQIRDGTKEEYAINFYNALSDGNIVIDEECGTSNKELSVREVVDDLKRQLMSFRYTKSGKITGKKGEGSYGNDDLGIACLMAQTWPSKARVGYYREYRKMLEELAKTKDIKNKARATRA